MFGNLGPMELVLIAFIVLMIFGARRLPEAGRGLGEAFRSFKDALMTPSDNKEIDAPKGHDKNGEAKG